MIAVPGGSAPTAAAVRQAEYQRAAPPAVAGEIIVGFEEGVPEARRNRVLAAVGAVEEEEFEEIDAELAEVDPNKVDEAIKKLKAHPRVEYAEPNFLLFADDHPGSPNDPAFHELWGLNNFGQTVNGTSGVADADIDAREAWAVTTGSASVVVGLIDTGVDFGHPDLGGSMETSPLMWINPGEDCPGCRTNGVDDDGNGYVDDWRGWDFVSNDNDPFDDDGHGTHVAGTIGAIGNNGVGVAGVNWTVKIMALKFLSAAGSGTTANAVKAVLYASDKGAQVTNNSWGGGLFSQALLDAIEEADANGSLVVAAAGNGGADGIGDDTDASPHYPSSYDVPNIISVAATDSSDAKASFSNYGKRTVDLGAPGANIYATQPEDAYRYASGTSMATAHVAGAAALATAAFPEAGHLGIKALLFRTVDPNSSLNGRTATDGRLNVDGAVRCAGAPKVWIDAPAPGFVVPVAETVAVRVIGANCASAAGVTVSATANGSPITLTARGDGLYSGTYTPAAAGPVTISASAQVGAATDTRAVSGSAVQNYRFEDAPFEWIDATAGGTNTGMSDDDASVTVSLPFAFTFYGEELTSVKISSNGYLVFGSSAATAFSNVAITNATAPNGLVAPFWDDLDPSAGGSVWYRTTGDAPDRRFVVAWVGVPRRLTSGTGTLEVALEEGTNEILFQYQDVSFENPSYDYGASATVGVESLDGTIGTQFSFNQAVLLPYQSAKAIRFTTRAAVLTITTTTLANGALGQPYSQTLRASGGTLPYSWSIAGGALPSGLTLDSASGQISGTPTTAGTYSFTARVADSATPAETATQPLSLTITAGAAQNYRFEDAPFAWIDATAGGTNTGISGDDTSVTVSLPFSFTFFDEAFTSVQISSNGYLVFGSSSATRAFNVAIPNANAPNGLVAPFWDDLDPSAGGAVWYRTTGSAPNRRFVVAWVGIPHYPDVGTATLEVVLEEGTNGILFQYQSAAFGNSSYDYGASATVGLESLDGTTGTQFSFNQAVLQPYENAKAIRFTRTAGVGITTTTLPDGTVGQSYSQTLQATGGTAPYSWEISAGSLPPGLSLSASTGTIAGRPTSAGTYGFSARVTDSGTTAETATQALTITIAGGTPLRITTASLPDGTVGQTYSQTLRASGGAPPYSWEIAVGSLPPGLSLSASTGTIAGRPGSAGTYSVTARVTDGATPAERATQALTITIASAPLRITTTSLPDGTVGKTYSQTLRASGGTAPYSWEISAGSLPPGLSRGTSTGTIAGTPTSAGAYSFTAEVSDSGTPAETAAKQLSVTIAAAPLLPPLVGAIPAAGARMGTRGAEVLTGTSDDEVFRALGGDDMILAAAGSDVVYGGPGDDVVRGGRGNDVAYGERGSDLLFGEADNDLLDGGSGVDRLWGGSGSDVILARDGRRDEISCGSGSDVVIADPRDRVARDCEVVRRG